MTEETLRGSHIVIPRVAAALKTAYSANHVLLSSLRGSVKHMHFHLIPVPDAVEKEWRVEAKWEKGHLFQFLGDRELRAFLEHQKERIEMGWHEKDQRAHHVKNLQAEVAILQTLLA